MKLGGINQNKYISKQMGKSVEIISYTFINMVTKTDFRVKGRRKKRDLYTSGISL